MSRPAIKDSTFQFAANWLAASLTFRRDVLDVQTPAQALKRIHHEEVLEEFVGEDSESGGDEGDETLGYTMMAERPLALIVTGDDARERVGLGEWRGRGSLLIVIDSVVPKQYRLLVADQSPSQKEAVFRARRQWGERLFQNIRYELRELSGKSDGAGNPYLNARSIDRHLGPSDPEPGEPIDSLAFVYAVEWR